MSARPILRGLVPPEFADTEGHTLPGVAAAPSCVNLVMSEGGARVDTHRVLAARDWLSDSDLGALDGGATVEQIEAKRRAATRERLQQVREEMRITRREWLLWALVFVLAIVVSAWLPEPWAGYGWHW